MQSIDRAFTVLRAVASRAGTSSLADVTKASGLPKSTVLRLLTALEEQGAIQVLGGRFGIGPGLAVLSHGGAPVSALKEIARPHLVELAELIQENVSLMIPDGDVTLYIDTAISESSVMVQDWNGERLPYHGSAGGLALLSSWTDVEIAELAASGLEAYTSTTVTTLAGLMAKVEHARRTGVALTHQEFSDDVNGFGSLVTGPDGEPLAAVNAYGPDYRFPGDRDAAEISAAVLETARAIADRLG
ncbi:MAG: IclR family transcriptional regulator [Acidimicrobiales bacterium]